MYGVVSRHLTPPPRLRLHRTAKIQDWSIAEDPLTCVARGRGLAQEAISVRMPFAAD